MVRENPVLVREKLRKFILVHLWQPLLMLTLFLDDLIPSFPRHTRCSGRDHISQVGSKWLNIALVALCTIMAISRQKEARSREYVLLLFRKTSRVLHSAQYHRQHCVLHAFEQFRALHMHNHDGKYPAPPGFEPGTSRLQTPVDTNEPSG